MIAGLLNILAIYDAFAGPFLAVSDNKDNEKKTAKTVTGGDKPPPTG
jgi:hypothetical protein